MDDLYSNNSYPGESETAGNAEIIFKINKIETALSKLHNKKDGKKSKKKKLKKQNKALKKENAQMIYLLQAALMQKNADNEKMDYLMQNFAMQQNAAQKKPQWWQQAIVNAAPQTVNAIASAFQLAAKSKKQNLLDKTQTVLYLPDGNGKK